MNVDYVSVARERRLTALETLECRQPTLPGLGKLKLAPLQDGNTVIPFRKRTVFSLDSAQERNESMNMPLPQR